MRNAHRVLLIAASSLIAGHAFAATQQYFDVNGATAGYGITNGSTYSWESPDWTATSGGGAATSNFVQDTSGTNTGFPRFYGGSSGNTYTVTVGQIEPIVGMYMNASGVNLIISQSSSAGGLAVEGGALQGFLIGTSTTAGSITIYAPISGSGGVEQESYGALSLFGNNTFTGGFESTGGQNTYYNNASSFGSAGITITGTSKQGFINSGAAGLAVSNPITVGTASSGIIWNGGAASGSTPGAIFSGSVTLPSTGTFTIDTTTTATVVDEISGAISGASSLAVTDAGKLILAGANAYTGTTTVTSPATLVLGASNTIATSSEVILGGGTLNPDGMVQNMSATTLGMTAGSMIDFGAGASQTIFANSSALTWTGTLNLANWTSGTDALRFGTDSTGLTAAQLGDIEFNGGGLGTAALNSDGFVVQAPEPAALSLLALAALPVLRRRRA